METGEKLWKEIKDKVKDKVCTDYWKAYEKFIPQEKHVQSKKETYTVEGYNSLFRHFLARLRRKTKCYMKAVYMLILSVKLLMFKWNNDLSILLFNNIHFSIPINRNGENEKLQISAYAGMTQRVQKKSV